MRARARLRAGAVAVALLASLAVLASPQPAHAAGELQLSTDGANWSSTLEGPLFDSIAHLIPGDTENATLYVRNTGPTDGDVRVTITDVAVSDALFANAIHVAIAPAGRAAVPVSLGSAEPCTVLSEGLTVGPGETVALGAVLSVDALDPVDGRNTTASFRLTVALSESLPTGAAPAGCDPGGVGMAGIAAITPFEQVGGESSGRGLADVVVERTTSFLMPNSGDAVIGWRIMTIPAALATGAGIVALGSRRRRSPRPDKGTQE